MNKDIELPMATRRFRGLRYQCSRYRVLKIPVLYVFITVATFLFFNFGLSISFHNRSVGESPQFSDCPGTDSFYTDQLSNVCRDSDPCITVHVFGYRRFNATQQLLNMLSKANYSTYSRDIPLIIHVDRPIQKGGSEKAWHDTELIADYGKGMSWPHGPKILDVKCHHHGLKHSWLSAWPDPRSNDIMIAFEDDMVLSPEYFVWLVKVLDEYNLWQASNRDPFLLGVSLAPVLIDEVGNPPHDRSPHEVISPERHPLYLHGLPSSWGAVYFGNQWKEFLRFVDVRARSPFFSDSDDGKNKKWKSLDGQDDPNLWLPQSKTNIWRNSWKRFMIDFAYGRGYYMLHPNMGPSLGLATSTFLAGEHFGNAASRNPRQGTLAKRIQLCLEEPLPPYIDLPVMDIYSRTIDSIAMAKRGDEFVRRISALSPSHSMLATLWRRPCVLDKILTPVKSFRTDGQNKMLLMVPEGSIEQQMLTLTCGAIVAGVLGRSLILPPVRVHGMPLQIKKGIRWISLGSLIDPIDIQAIFSNLDVAYLNMDDLHQWDPLRITVFGASIDNEDTFFSSVGWEHVPQFSWNFECQHVPPLLNERHVYSAFGTCSDEMLVLASLPRPLISDLRKLESFDYIHRALMKSVKQLQATTG